MSAVAIIGGFLAWTLTEYWIHRVVGHVLPSPLRARHIAHHLNPADIAMDPRWVVLWLLLIIGTSENLSVIGGFLGYGTYEARHWCLHHTKFYNRHWEHHDNPVGNFAVTFSLWDYVFRTAL